MIPLIIPENLDFEEYAESTDFKHIARILVSLSLSDDRIVEQFKLIEHGGGGGMGGGPFIPPEFAESEIDIKKFKISILNGRFAEIIT